MIFSRPKPKTPSKPIFSKKGTTKKNNPPKETTTSIVGPSNKGKENEDLSIPDNQVQDEPKDSPIEEQEKDHKVLLYIIHIYLSILISKLTIFLFLRNAKAG